MKQRVDELRALRQEARQFLLQGGVNVIVLVGSNLEMLFELAQ